MSKEFCHVSSNLPCYYKGIIKSPILYLLIYRSVVALVCSPSGSGMVVSSVDVDDVFVRISNVFESSSFLLRSSSISDINEAYSSITDFYVFFMMAVIFI